MATYTVEEKQEYWVVNTNESEYEIHPLDEEPPEDLAKIIAECLEERLEEAGVDFQDHLLGYCHKNSIALFRKLCSRGYSPKLKVGVITGRDSESSIVDAFENVKNAHQWVTVDGYIVEICSEGGTGVSGNIYVSKRQPNNYKEYLSFTETEFNSLDIDCINADNIRDVVEQY